MKNYIVKALIEFDDTEENVRRKPAMRDVGASEWNCTKERYEFLKSKGAVELIEIKHCNQPELELVDDLKESKKETPKKKTIKNKSKED